MKVTRQQFDRIAARPPRQRGIVSLTKRQLINPLLSRLTRVIGDPAGGKLC